MADSEFKDVWREGPYLIARNRVAQFPARCVVCGEEQACRPLACKIRKRPGFLPLLIWAAPIFLPSVLVNPYVCPAHRKQELSSRRIGHVLISIAITLIAIVLVLTITTKRESPAIMLLVGLGPLLTWVWVYYRIYRRRILWAVRINKNDAWIEGVHQSVLDRVAEIPA
jgi:hypothetical protein